MRHGGREYGHVLSGRLEVQIGFETYSVGPGDSIHFDSTTPHRLSNTVRPAVHRDLVRRRAQRRRPTERLCLTATEALAGVGDLRRRSPRRAWA